MCLYVVVCVVGACVVGGGCLFPSLCGFGCRFVGPVGLFCLLFGPVGHLFRYYFVSSWCFPFISKTFHHGYVLFEDLIKLWVVLYIYFRLDCYFVCITRVYLFGLNYQV